MSTCREAIMGAGSKLPRKWIRKEKNRLAIENNLCLIILYLDEKKKREKKKKKNRK